VTSFLPQLKKQIAQGFKGKLKSGIIRRYNYAINSLGDRQPINSIDYPFQGIREEFDARYKAQAQIPVEDVKILVILGLTQVAPDRADKVFIENMWHEVRQVLSIDPAGASAQLQAYVIASG
jgi:hypothetical protein